MVTWYTAYDRLTKKCISHGTVLPESVSRSVVIVEHTKRQDQDQEWDDIKRSWIERKTATIEG